jgi:hypothetical protein
MLSDLSWSHDINKIIDYLNIYKKTINYFKKRFPDKILDVELENLTTNKIKQGEKIFNFCDLTWKDDYLNFYKDKSLFSRTNSSLQIRDKIQSYDMNKYKPYYKLIKNS